MKKIIAIVSGKGGTGKTMFTANMGALLAMRGERVLIIDMDMGLRNVDLYLGLENKVVYNLKDVLSGMCRIRQAIIKDKRFESLSFIAATPSKDHRDITKLHLEVLLEKVADDYDYVLIDSPAGIGEDFMMAASVADTAVIVTEGEMAAMRDADTVDRMLRKLGIIDVKCVINKVKAELMSVGAIPSLSSVSASLRVDVVGIIQYDDNIFISANIGVPIVMKPGTYIEKNFSKITDRILA